MNDGYQWTVIRDDGERITDVEIHLVDREQVGDGFFGTLEEAIIGLLDHIGHHNRILSPDLSAALWQVARETQRLRVTERNLDAALAMLQEVEEREDRDLDG